MPHLAPSGHAIGRMSRKRTRETGADQVGRVASTGSSGVLYRCGWPLARVVRQGSDAPRQQPGSAGRSDRPAVYRTDRLREQPRRTLADLPRERRWVAGHEADRGHPPVLSARQAADRVRGTVVRRGRINADGTGLRLIAQGIQPACPPDGSRIAYMYGHCCPTTGGIFVVDVDGGGARQVVDHALARDPPDYVGEHSVEHPTWSPDGRSIAFGLFSRLRVLHSLADFHRERRRRRWAPSR